MEGNNKKFYSTVNSSLNFFCLKNNICGKKGQGKLPLMIFLGKWKIYCKHKKNCCFKHVFWITCGRFLGKLNWLEISAYGIFLPQFSARDLNNLLKDFFRDTIYKDKRKLKWIFFQVFIADFQRTWCLSPQDFWIYKFFKGLHGFLLSKVKKISLAKIFSFNIFPIQSFQIKPKKKNNPIEIG